MPRRQRSPPSAPASPPRGGEHGSWPSRREDGSGTAALTARAGRTRAVRSSTAGRGTHPSLELLREFGVDPSSPEVSRAIARVRENVRWDYDGEPYFDGEVEPCINGGALAIAAYFGQDGAHIVETLLAGRLADGGWNCWDEDGRVARRSTPRSARSRGCGRGSRRPGDRKPLHQRARRARSTCSSGASSGAYRPARSSTRGSPMPSFPTRWYYDVLRALDYFRTRTS